VQYCTVVIKNLSECSCLFHVAQAVKFDTLAWQTTLTLVASTSSF
jgi:hypothetical protein